MTDELTMLRLSKQLKGKDIVEVVQRLYPSFDKTMLSKCERGDKYGIVLRRNAMNALIREFAPETIPAVKKRRDGHHRLTSKIMARLEKSDYSELQQCLKANGIDTVQAWLTEMVKSYINTTNEKEQNNDQTS